MTNPTALKFVASGAGITSRTLGNHLGEFVYNVKSFGAVGNNTNNDRGAIQSCLDVAFRDTNYNGWSDSTLTRLVYFPAGIYKIDAPLLIPSFTHGGMMYGDGMGVSVINNVTSGSIVIHANGLLNSTMRDMSLWSAGGPGSICYLWDEDVYTASSSTKEFCWINVEFKGAGNGIVAGQNGQCDVSLVLNCWFHNHPQNGIWTRGGNLLSWVVQGSRFDNCISAGIRTPGGGGNIPTIQGCYFSNNGQNDIVNDNEMSLCVLECYSDSPAANASISVNGPTKIIGYTYMGSGDMLAIGGNGRTPLATTAVCMDACTSPSGTIRDFAGGSSKLYLRACNFGVAPGAYSGTVVENI